MHQLADNAFNYSVLGERGFNTLIGLVEKARCFQISYSQASDVQEFLEQEVLQPKIVEMLSE